MDVGVDQPGHQPTSGGIDLAFASERGFGDGGNLAAAHPNVAQADKHVMPVEHMRTADYQIVWSLG